MKYELIACSACGAADRCEDCFGTGAEGETLHGTCVSCGGTGEEPPMLPTCPPEGCGASGPGASL